LEPLRDGARPVAEYGCTFQRPEVNMKTPHYDEKEVTHSFFRHAPALAWLALFGVFAVGGALTRDEPRQMAGLAIAAQLEASESAAAASVSQHATVVRDAAVIAHEELDPAGVGLTSTR
jgi:hypothetical protein